MSSLGELLDRAFQAAAVAAGKPALSKNKDQAEFIGISQPHLSRIRGGDSRLTEDLATRIARKLGPSDNVEARERLRQDLLDAASEAAFSAGSLKGVLDLFVLLKEKRNGLICVEYRDKPRTVRDAGRNPFISALAEAIVEGLCFAQFQPFGKNFGQDDSGCHALDVRSYLGALQLEVRKVHRLIREETIRTATRLKKSDTEIDEAASRVVLYERDSQLPVLGSGIQSRLFYVEYEDERSHQEVWEWIAGQEQDAFIRRDAEWSAPVNVIQKQFTPITVYWSRYQKLPRDDDAFEEARALAQLDGAIFDPNDKWWTIYEI